MSSVNIDLAADTILNVMVGQQDENEVREVVFDFSDWYTTYGSGTISLAIQRPKDEWPYEGTLTVDNSTHKATWEISDTDSAYAGVGQIQLSYTVGTAVKKSVVYRFTVHKSLGALGNVITPIQIQTFIDEVTEALEDMQDELADVKQDLIQYQTSSIDLESGNFNDSTGQKTTGNTRIRNVRLISVSDLYSITIPTGYDVWVYRFAKNQTYINGTGWKNGEVRIADVITSDTEFINLLFRNTSTPSSDISSQVSTVQSGFSVKTLLSSVDDKLSAELLQLEDDVNINNDVLIHSNLSTASQRYASGITYTIDPLTGIVTAKGTATYDAWIHLYPIGNINIDSNAVYKLMGTPEGSSSSKYYLYAENSSSTGIAFDYGNGAIINNSSFRICFIVKAGQTVDLSFKPRLLKYDSSALNAENTPPMVINSNINKQYWDNDKEVSNTYFSLSNLGGVTYASANGYRSNILGWFPAGTYHYKNLSGAFTVIANANTGALVTLQGGFGKSQYIHSGNFTTAYPFYMFATSNNDAQPYVSNTSEFPSAYVYGLWGEKGKVIYINADGSGDFTTLKAGLEEAIKYKDCVVNVGAGTYDLTSEFSSEIASMDSSSSELSGLQIGNGMTINFSSKALVIFNYTGNNTYVKSRFSPFNMVPGTKGFTLNNLNLECSNCRYAIHDESNANANPYHNKYIDCKITKDNSANTSWANPLVIGGGLGQDGQIDIIRSYFKSETISSIPTGKQVNYHNASTAGSKSKLFVEGCYFDGAYSVGMSYYGSSTEMTTMQINGCSCPSEPSVNQEGSASIVNVELRKFNNTIRT